MDGSVEIRACGAEDLATLRQRWHTVDDVHLAHFQEQHGGRATYLVAWGEGEPLGSALVQWRGPIGTNARLAFPMSVEINHLHVRPELRGCGVGTSLIRAAEDLVASRGLRQVGLAVSIENSRAARLYARLGYQRTGTIDIFRRHIEEVKQVVPADRLLVFEVGQGWPPLCDFLKVDRPAEPFPHLNEKKVFNDPEAFGEMVAEMRSQLS